MEEKKLNYREPIVLCSHNFDISDRKAFASELAILLGANINIIERVNEIIDTVKIPGATITKNLYCQNATIETDFRYVLEHGDEAHMFYNNFIQYVFPFEIDYDIIIDDLIHNDERNSEDVYDCFFDIKKFGVKEVHFNIYNDVDLSKPELNEWSQVEKMITNLENHFVYKF